MGLMDIFSTFMSGQKKNAALVDTLKGLISGNSGGLGDLLGKFSANGMNDIVESWVGNGKNLPVSMEQLKKAIGNDTLKEISAKTGLTEKTATKKLTGLLPNIVDKLTPDGIIPQGDVLTKGMDLLDNFFGKKK